MKDLYYFVIVLAVMVVFPSCKRQDSMIDRLNKISNLIQEDSTNTELYFRRAELYAEIHEQDHVLSDLNKVLDHDSNFTRAYYARGRILYIMNNDIGAIRDYSRAIMLDPNNPHVGIYPI